jgi:hypothetical protein
MSNSLGSGTNQQDMVDCEDQFHIKNMRHACSSSSIAPIESGPSCSREPLPFFIHTEVQNARYSCQPNALQRDDMHVL